MVYVIILFVIAMLALWLASSRGAEKE